MPTGVQNLAESVVDFVTDGIIMQTMGPEGLTWLPFLTSLFCFIFFANIFEVIPFIQFPATARMAIPLSLALIVWVLFNFMGIKSQGFFGYIKSSLFPPGVPKALYILVTPIEFLSTFIVRPFSLAVRLFANELAGHLLLVTFAGAVRRAVHQDRRGGDPAAARRHAGPAHRLRGPRRRPAGLHLHHPHRRVHRRRHAPRALGGTQ